MSKPPLPTNLPPSASGAAGESPSDDDAYNPRLNVSCLDFLLIELVPLAQRMADKLEERERAVLQDFPSGEADTHAEKKSATAESETARLPASLSPLRIETRESVSVRLEGLGYRVGQGLVERFSPGRPRPQTSLDAIKFLCKDLWTVVFRKQIDNLKTNHRGVFVLTDARFGPLARVSADRRAGADAARETLGRAQMYLNFPRGVMRGALSGLLGAEQVLGITAETVEIPIAVFQIRTAAGAGAVAGAGAGSAAVASAIATSVLR